MSNFNLVVLMGRLTRDIELRFTPKGSAVANIGLAINRKWKSESGEAKEETTFIDATAWGKTAEVMAQYLHKGNPVHISGRLQGEVWEDKNTKEKRSKLKVVIESFAFIGSKEGESEKPQPQAVAPKEAAPTEEQDSIPF